MSAYESEQKQREQFVAKVQKLQEKNVELQKVTTNHFLYTAEGERLFCERHNYGFISITKASTGISRLPIIRLIHSQLKSAGHILTMRFQYGMCMCIGGRMFVYKSAIKSVYNFFESGIR